MARLLLQGRSASDRTKASQVDGLDGEFRAPERYPDHFAFDRISDCSIAHRDRQRSGEWHRVYYWSRFHHRFMLGMRLFVFAHGMRTLKPSKSLQATRDGRFRRRCAMAGQASSAFAEDVIRSARLSSGRR